MVLNIFKNIHYDVYCKAIFVLFGALMVISLFIDTKAVSNSTLFYVGISSVIYSLVMWIINDLARTSQEQLNELRGQINFDYMDILKKITVLRILGTLLWLTVIFVILLIK